MEFAVGPMGTLLSKLAMLLKGEYDLQKSVKGRIRFLKAELESMQAALAKVSGVPAEQLDMNTRLWARDVREMSYDIEDSIDTFLVLVEKNKAADPHSIKALVDKTLSSVSSIKKRHQMATKIKDFEFHVKQLKERHDRYKVDFVSASPTVEYVDPRLEALYKMVTDLVGIDESRSKLIDMLNKRDEASQKKLKSVSVVGVGGLGKTTLAKAVYDELKGGFQCCAFISVGQNPSVKKVLRDILLELHRYMYNDTHSLTMDVKQLIDLIRDFLNEKRYFIVIDDLWDLKYWQTIKMALVDNNSGSRFVITTRNIDVANEAHDVYNLEPLSSDYSRQLLYTRIFDGERNCLDTQPDDELLTSKILKKCGGIPLAIITMASLLAGKPREQWFEVYSLIGISQKGISQVDTTMKILSMSYYDMPYHLRTCLLYLCIFPEDSFIEKRSLIWMWIAEGFIHEEQGLGLFELGERYFHALINRSMIEPAKSSSGSINGCHLHDIVLELIRSLSYEENFVTIMDNNQGTPAHKNVHRLCQHKMVIQHNSKGEVDMAHVRSFVAHSCTIVKSFSFSSFQLLRVLVLEDSEASEEGMKADLGKLLHLRYLSLGRNYYIRELPKGIEALKFLQTLDLEGTGIKELPSGISKLTRLICLLGDFENIDYRVIKKLTSLQELSHLDQTRNELQLCRALANLKELRVLRAKFKLSEDNGGHEALLDSLSHMRKLHHLELGGFSSLVNPEQVSGWYTPGAAVLSKHVRVLLLWHLEFSSLPTCINSSVLPKLSELLLNVGFIDHRDMRIFGKFQELCDVHVFTSFAEKMRLLVVYGCDEGSFRKLSSFSIDLDQVFVMFRGRKVGAPIIPNLKDLSFGIPVDYLENFCVHRCQNISDLLSMIGWNHLPSLKNVDAGALNLNSFGWTMDKVKVAMNRLANSHPNRPCLRMNSETVRYQPPLESIKVFDLPIHVWMFRGTAARFDLTNLASMEKVTARIYCLYATPTEVLQVEAALRCAVDVHPNNVILEMERIGEDEMDELFSEQEEQQLMDHDATKKEEQGIAAAGQQEVESLTENITSLRLQS